MCGEQNLSCGSDRVQGEQRDRTEGMTVIVAGSIKGYFVGGLGFVLFFKVLVKARLGEKAILLPFFLSTLKPKRRKRTLLNQRHVCVKFFISKSQILTSIAPLT